MATPIPIRRRAKTKRVPITYQLSDIVAEVGTMVRTKHDIHFGSLTNFKLAYVLISGGVLPKRGRIDGWAARFIKVPPLWKALTGYDAIVEVREAVWKILSEHQREALIAHELSHGDSNEKGDLVVQKHDLEEFAWVARHYGAWDEGIELFGKQLSLFGADAPAASVDQVFEDKSYDAAAQSRAAQDEPVAVQ